MNQPLRVRPDQSQDLGFSDADFRAIARLAEEDAGLQLTEANSALVFSRLVKHVRMQGMSRFSDFIAHVRTPAGRKERAAMIEAITTNTTRFFREAYHYDILARDLLPELVDRARRGQRVRFWSAGCSSGEEAYSLAAVVLSVFPDAGRHDLRILGTDINSRVLAEAEAAIYPAEAAENIPEPMRRILFGPGSKTEARLTVAEGPRALTSFRRLNFMDPWPVRGPFDAIFCRNVAIYMDEPVQARLWSGLEAVLAPTGLLFIGHSERLGPEFRNRLVPCGPTAYRRP